MFVAKLQSVKPILVIKMSYLFNNGDADKINSTTFQVRFGSRTACTATTDLTN